MDQVREYMDNLLKALEESELFRVYENSRKELMQHPQYAQQMNEFRKKNYLLQASPHVLTKEEQGEMFAERAKLRSNPLIARYLDSELDLCRTLQRICLEIINLADLGIEPFEDSISI